MVVHLPLLLLGIKGFALLLKPYFTISFKAPALSPSPGYVWVSSHTAADPFSYVTISSLYPFYTRLPCHFHYPSIYPKGAQGITLSNATGWKSDQLVFHLVIWWNKAFHDFIDALNGQIFYSELLIQYMLNKINSSISDYFIPQNKQTITFS